MSTDPLSMLTLEQAFIDRGGNRVYRIFDSEGSPIGRLRLNIKNGLVGNKQVAIEPEEQEPEAVTLSPWLKDDEVEEQDADEATGV